MADLYMVFTPGSASPPAGPLTSEQLRAAIAAGTFSEGAMAMRVGDTAWQPLRDVARAPGDLADAPAPVELAYEVTVDGSKIVGPVSLELLRRGVLENKIPPDAKVRQVGTTAWRAVQALTNPIAPSPSATVRERADDGPVPTARSEAAEAKGGASSDSKKAKEIVLLLVGVLTLVGLVVFLVKSGGSKPTTTSSPSTPAPPSAPSAAPTAAPTHTAADYFAKQSGELIYGSEKWQARVSAYWSDGYGPGACGESYVITGADEFERRASRQKANEACKGDINKAIDFLKVCPVVESLKVKLGEYDFDKRRFPVRFEKGVQASKQKRLYLREQLLLAWDGLAPAGKGETQGFDACKADYEFAQEAYNAATFSFDVLDESRAKSIRSAGPTKLEIAFVLDGASAADNFACNDHLAKSYPTGVVVAWRLPPVVEWTITKSSWIPPESCAEAQRFLSSLASPAASTSASTSASASASSSATGVPKPAPPPKAACHNCFLNVQCNLLQDPGGGPCCRPLENPFDCPTELPPGL